MKQSKPISSLSYATGLFGVPTATWILFYVTGELRAFDREQWTTAVGTTIVAWVLGTLVLIVRRAKLRRSRNSKQSGGSMPSCL